MLLLILLNKERERTRAIIIDGACVQPFHYRSSQIDAIMMLSSSPSCLMMTI